MIAPFEAFERQVHPWREPLAVASRLRHREGALALLSDGGPLGRWSFVAADPDHAHAGPISDLTVLQTPSLERSVIGLLAYDCGARPATGPRPHVWPDLMWARYPSMLAFDHLEGVIWILGNGADSRTAVTALDRARQWLSGDDEVPEPPPPAVNFDAEASDQVYLDAVAEVTTRIAAGDLFQANIARGWSGMLAVGADPFDVMLRLAERSSPYGAFWRLGDRAIVSNSPELFLTFDPATRQIDTRPIKGTRPRSGDPDVDAELARDLLASAKDRAENLMIVDLMRNDLSRVSRPGSVEVTSLFEVETHPTIHHLVSAVKSEAAAGVDAADILAATFPPGSITGAPKHQAMKVIAALEPPRGPWCGTLFHLDTKGRLTASVLIRTASFQKHDDKWTFRTLAGAGIVADSQPDAELAETETKILALKEALTGSAGSSCRP